MKIGRYFTQPQRQELEPLVEAVGIQSSLPPFRKTHLQTTYPQSVVQALQQLVVEYNDVLQVPRGGREWRTDYQYCEPAAFAVQIDMVGLPNTLLEYLATMPVEEVRETLRQVIFEIDSSVAMYQLLERIFAQPRQDSNFKRGWRMALENLRSRYRKPIALLAVTDEKYDSMLETEFGMNRSNPPTASMVRAMTGFDAFFGPEEFHRLVKDNGGDCPYLLFVRASEPVSKLRKPGQVIDHPLLGDSEMRRAIRANTVTLNVDTPGSSPETWVNDTKAYMPGMGLGYLIRDPEDLNSRQLDAFFWGRGIDPPDVHNGRVIVHAKPVAASYGAYGHVRGAVTDTKFRSELRRNFSKRPGGYIIQPELAIPVVHSRKMSAGYIDRIFMGYIQGKPWMLGGFRNYMPTDSAEYKAGRLHGSGEAFWGEILPQG
jgi:hypothetical protein